MTADRRTLKWVARWFMRAETAGQILRLVFFGLTGLSVALSTLKRYGYGEYALPFTGALIGGTLLFMWAYDQFDVLNQKNRDKMDRSTNFAGPTMLIDDILIANAVFAAQRGRPPDEDERQVMRQTIKQEWQEYRDGADLTATTPNGGDSHGPQRVRT